MNMIELERVSVDYGRSRVLNDVTLGLRSEEVLVVLGMNGSGKTTMLKTMLGLIRPSEGTVRHFGQPPSLEARRRMGAVFDEPAHWDRLTGWENAYLFARSYGLSDTEAQERLEHLFTWSGLALKKNRAVETYSYGMRRKLAIIEAMVHRPDVLFLDEPTMGLDHTSLLALNQQLRTVARNGQAVLVSTNDLAEASSLADRICVLDGGRMVGLGSAEDLLRPLVAGMQIEVRLASPISMERVRPLDGVDSVSGGEDERTIRFYFQANSGSPEALLSRIALMLSEVGGRIESVAVRKPDLGYLLSELSRGGDRAQS